MIGRLRETAAMAAGPPQEPFVSQRQLGILYALAAYGIWGLIPLYFRLLREVPPLELLCHRIVWSFVLLVLVLGQRRDFAWIGELRGRPGIVLGFLASALMLAINWFVYIWAVGAGRVIDASLGYFINPLVSVVLAVVVLKERLRAVQWAAVGLAALGVLWLTLSLGQLPWIGLTLALSFGCYGLLRKTAALDALAGLALETTLLFPIALGYLWWLGLQGASAWGRADAPLRAELVAAGPITAIPLLSFAAGARRIPLSLLGILQYVGPTLQLMLGVWVFHEPFTRTRLVGFALIWLSVFIYSCEGVYSARMRKALGA
jgi:chloramphenicol-sensitive protein RarD